MNCNSKDNSLKRLQSLNIIDDTRRLLITPDMFEAFQQELLQEAKTSYGYTGDKFYTVETETRKTLRGHNYHRDNKVTISRAVPNEQAFEMLDNLRNEKGTDNIAFAPIDFFDDVILEEEPITPSFEKFIEYKESLLRKAEKRLAKIEADKKKFSSDKEALTRLVALEKQIKDRIEGNESLGIQGLKDELAELNKLPAIEKITYYSDRDLERLELLSRSENPEDLAEARSIINFYKALGTFSNKEVNPMFTHEQMFNESTELTLPAEVVSTLENLKDVVTKFDEKIYQKEKSALVNFVNNNSKIQKTFKDKQLDYDSLFFTENGLKDASWIDMFVMDITNGIFSHNGLVPQVMYTTLQEAMEKNLVYAKSVEARMNSIQSKVEEELRKKGYGIKIPGVKGVSYDLFRAKDSDGLYKDSITERYSSSFVDARNKMFSTFNNDIQKARLAEDPVERGKLFKTAYEKKLNWYRKNTIMMDIRVLPEFRNGEFSEFDSNFKEISDKHKQELINNLGQKGYDAEIKKQIKLLKEYKTNKEVYQESLLAEEGVSSIEQLSEDNQSKLRFWEATHNPFTMLDNYYDSKPITSGKMNVNSTMTYNYAIPVRKTATVTIGEGGFGVEVTDKDSGYYDERFEEIESNEVLKEFHDLLSEVNQKIYDTMPPEVREKFSASSIPALKRNFVEILFDPNTPLLQRISEAYRYIIDKLKGSFGINPEDSISYTEVDPITGKPEYKVNSSFLKTNQKTIEDRHYVELQRIKLALGKKITDKLGMYDTIDLSANPEVMRILAENLGVSATIGDIKKRLPNVDLKNIEISKVIKSAITDQIVQESSFDLPKILKMYSYMTMEYAARQEALPIIEMLKSHYEGIKNPNINSLGQSRINGRNDQTMLEGERKYAVKQMESWFERAVLGIYASKNELGDTRLKRALQIKLSKEEEKEILGRKMNTNITGRILEGDEKILQSKIKGVIGEVEKLVETSQGEDQDRARKALARLTGMENNLGKHFTFTALLDNVFNFIRLKGLGWNVSSYVTNFAEGQIANMVVASTGDYFTPENIYRANHIVKGSFVKNSTFGKVATPGAKKARVLMDRYRILQDATNELQKASSKSAFSKFEKIGPYEGTKRTEYLNQTPLMIAILMDEQIIGKDGQISNVWDVMQPDGSLHEDFRTEENINNWEEADGQSYFDFKSKVNKTIVNAHGDYDELRGSMASERISGKAMLMFKRWMARQFYQRFAMTPQTYIEVGIKDYQGRYFSHTASTGLLHGAIIGFGGLTLVGAGPLGLVAGGAIGGAIGKFYGKDSGMGFLRDLSIQTRELFLTTMRIPINNIVGKNVISQDRYNKILRDSELSERDVRNLKANMVDMSITMFWIGLLLLTKAMLWDDDDEETDARRQAHNLLANRFMQLSGQSAMYLNPKDTYENISNMAFIKFLGDVGKTAMAAEQLLEGKDTYASGPNAGESKLLTQFSKTFVPNIIKSPGSLGFESHASRQFEASPFDSWFFGPEKIAKTEIKARRATYRSGLREQGNLEEGDIEEMVNERYPPKKGDETYVDVLNRIPE